MNTSTISKKDKQTIEEIQNATDSSELSKIWLADIEQKSQSITYSRSWIFIGLVISAILNSVFLPGVDLLFLLINTLILLVYTFTWTLFNTFKYRYKNIPQYNTSTIIILSVIFNSYVVFEHLLSVNYFRLSIITIVYFNIIFLILPALEAFYIREIVYLLYFPYDRSADEENPLGEEDIDHIISWLYSDNIIHLAMALKLIDFLEFKSAKLDEAIEKIDQSNHHDVLQPIIENARTKLEGLQVFENVWEKVKDVVEIDDKTEEVEEELEEIPTKKLHYQPETTLFARFIEKIYTWIYSIRGKTKSEAELMVEERRCCKLHGRLGDKYCNMCGRVISEELIAG